MPRPPPRRPICCGSCALATVVTARNIAATIIVIRIIFFIDSAPNGVLDSRRARIRRIPWHHYRRTATSATGAPRPAQRQTSWTQQLSCRPLAQRLKTAILTRPMQDALQSTSSTGTPGSDRATSVTLPPSPPSSPAPNAPAASPLTPAATPPSLSFPISWLLDHAAAPIKYRSLIEVAKLSGSINEQVAALPFTHRPALTLALAQQSDGTWSHSMLTLPSVRSERFDGIGTITAVRRLLEYGWDKD